MYLEEKACWELYHSARGNPNFDIHAHAGMHDNKVINGTAKECQEVCKNVSLCQHFFWEGSTTNHTTCSIKTEKPDKIHYSRFAISGPKSCSGECFLLWTE